MDKRRRGRTWEKIDFRAEGKQLIVGLSAADAGRAADRVRVRSRSFCRNDIAPGGVTGIATVLSSVTGLNVGLLSFLINLPLFAIGWRRVGWRFAARSFICDAAAVAVHRRDAGCIDLAGNMMLAAHFRRRDRWASELGMVVRAGATTGGTDMAAMIVHEHWSMF